MGSFTEKEIRYLRGQRLGRLATVGADGTPHVMPVGFHVSDDLEVIEIGGHGLSRSKKWRDLQANPRVAFVVDDLAGVNPWTPRGIRDPRPGRAPPRWWRRALRTRRVGPR